jgi:hypothetical protein
MVHAYGRFFVAFTRLLPVALAGADVIIGDEARPAVLVLVKVQTRALVVDDDGIALILAQLHEVARHLVLRRTVAVGVQAHQRFRAQIIEPLARTLRGVAEGLDLAAPGEQQVALDQVCQAKIRLSPEQGFNAIERQIEVVALDLLEHLAQLFVGARVCAGGERGKKDGAGENQCPGD